MENDKINDTLPENTSKENEKEDNNGVPTTENDSTEQITENNNTELETENSNSNSKNSEHKVEFQGIPIVVDSNDSNEAIVLNSNNNPEDFSRIKPQSSLSSKFHPHTIVESLPNQIINKEESSNEALSSNEASTEFNFCDMFDNKESLMRSSNEEVDNNITNLNHLNDLNAINNLNRPSDMENFNNIAISKKTVLNDNYNNIDYKSLKSNPNYKDNVLLGKKLNFPLRQNRIVNIENSSGSNSNLIRIFHKSDSIAANINSIENKNRLKPKLGMQRHSTFVADSQYNRRNIKDLFSDDNLINKKVSFTNENNLNKDITYSTPNFNDEGGINNINKTNDDMNKENGNDDIDEQKLKDFIKEKKMKKRATFVKQPTFADPRSKSGFGKQPLNDNNGVRPSFIRQETKYKKKDKKQDSFSSSLDLLLYKSHEDMGYIDKIMLQKMNNTNKNRTMVLSTEFEDEKNEEYERRYYYPIEFTDNVESRKLYYEYKIRKKMSSEPLIIHRRNLLFVITLFLTLFLLALLLYDYHSLIIKEKNSKFFGWINAIYILHIVDISLALLAFIYANESSKKIFTWLTIILGVFTVVLFICRFIFNWTTKDLIPIDYK